MPDRLAFRLYTRCPDAATFALLAPHLRPGDRLWGWSGMPSPYRTFTATHVEGLLGLSDADLAGFVQVNLDVEDQDANAAYTWVAAAKAFLDAYAKRAKRHIPLSAFYHLELLSARPDLVSLADIVIFGKSFWVAPSLVGRHSTWRNLVVEAAPFTAMVRAASRVPGVLLGNNYQERGGPDQHYTADEIAANFRAVIELPPTGAGCSVACFYYSGTEVGGLVLALGKLRG